MIRCLFLIIISVFICSAAFASQTLTLSLETPSLSAPSASSPPAKSTPDKTPTTKTQTVKVGRVGLVSKSVASIHKSKSDSSQVYAKVKAETPLAIVREEDKWLGVLMVNGATGWIRASSVKLIGYDLVANKPEPNRSTQPSRGTAPQRGSLPESDIIRTAMGYAGVPYVYGGVSPTSGMDCSAFVRSVFSQYGVSLPRTAREQAQVGSSVPWDQLQPGDRLYFACKNTYPDHCGIYAGDGYFVHCSSTHKGVAVDKLSDAFYARSLVAAKRS
ncbi:MAG: C40 family peptidase [Armatimonadetes bacterium]|nr:C40 family peptidase [Armatimonadota bacterium]